MNLDTVIYLGMTLILFIIFAVIVYRTYRRSAKDRTEQPKYRMLDKD